eukprot:GFYU01001172.1.p1 GENE.GFYU01001172.1~~GFYU01001172.1.p1  ORF type:complete len:204 (+),score=13.90 GFYU01001172.1:201-812(+)
MGRSRRGGIVEGVSLAPDKKEKQGRGVNLNGVPRDEAEYVKHRTPVVGNTFGSPISPQMPRSEPMFRAGELYGDKDRMPEVQKFYKDSRNKRTQPQQKTLQSLSTPQRKTLIKQFGAFLFGKRKPRDEDFAPSATASRSSSASSGRLTSATDIYSKDDNDVPSDSNLEGVNPKTWSPTTRRVRFSAPVARKVKMTPARRSMLN